jgi:hypothetical protein
MSFRHGAFCFGHAAHAFRTWGVLPPHMGRKHPRGGEVENGKLPPHVFRGGRFSVHTFMQSASSR